ncbi:hypothetical protein [Dactylosporangium sp. CA-233914]|uniref:hypothetical protein n=1 Tax=Dactylosporangium sp. CA-233914 TaxID=3239934 RepID=UPI003D916527
MQQSTPYGNIALALGIASVPALFVSFFGPLLAVAAIATGALAMTRDRARSGRAVVGIVLAAVALTGAVLLVIRPDS